MLYNLNFKQTKYAYNKNGLGGKKISETEMIDFSNAIIEIVSDVTQIKQVFVYGNASKICLNADPIEIFIEMSAHKIDNIDTLMGNIKSELRVWKGENNFKTPVNLSIIPMNWKLEVGI